MVDVISFAAFARRPRSDRSNERVVRFCDVELIADHPGAARLEGSIQCGASTGALTLPVEEAQFQRYRWYLERYPRWPATGFAERAAEVEAALAEWGRAMLRALEHALGADFGDWIRDGRHPGRTLILECEAWSHPADPEAGRAAAVLFALPWELLHDGASFAAVSGLSIIRRVARAEHPPPRADADRLRVLLIVARPAAAGLIDPCASAAGVLDALDEVGDMVAVTVLRPATPEALRAALAGDRYDIIHFDGHGDFDPHSDEGTLCFEHDDPEARARGTAQRLGAREFGAIIDGAGVRLVVLEACRTATASADAGPGTALTVARAGVDHVIAMTHAVLVDTTRRFTERFYARVCRGMSIAAALHEARIALMVDPRRDTAAGGPPLSLQDWAVPVLIRGGGDQPLIDPHARRLPRQTERAWHAWVRDLPELRHGFVGRVAERLAVEAALHREGWISLVGMAGQGKTALAVATARWLVRTGAFDRLAYVAIDELHDLAHLLHTIDAALSPPGAGARETRVSADDLIGRLDGTRALLVLDGLDRLGAFHPPPTIGPLRPLLTFAHRWARADGCAVIITSRDASDELAALGPTLRLGGLDRDAAIDLLARACRADGTLPDTPDLDVLDPLVDEVDRHPGSLVALPALLERHGLDGLLTALREGAAGPFAALDLGLEHFPERWQRALACVAVLRRGVSRPGLMCLLGSGAEETSAFEDELVSRALADAPPRRSGIVFHPALPTLVARRLDATRLTAWRKRADAAYGELVDLLHGLTGGPMREMALDALSFEVPNLLAVLERLTASPRPVVDPMQYCLKLAELLSRSPFGAAFEHVEQHRERLAARRAVAAPAEWTEIDFEFARAEVDGYAARRDGPSALRAARRLVARLDAMVDETPLVQQHRARARVMLASSLQMCGEAESALPLLDQARHGLTLAMSADPSARRWRAICLDEWGDVLVSLGRYAEACEVYTEALDDHLAVADLRGAAVSRGQRATARFFLGDLEGALQGHIEARETFDQLGEQRSVAIAWHMIGVIEEHAGRPHRAEDAYRESLIIKQRIGDRVGTANTMTQLAVLVHAAGRAEESLGWDQKALDLRVTLGDRAGEADTRANMAVTLRELGRLDEAEMHARRALATKTELGPSGSPWMVLDTLHHIALARGDEVDARALRDAAMAGYADYRRAGGHSGVAPEVADWFAGIGARLPHAGAIAPAIIGDLDALPESRRSIAEALLAFGRGDPEPARAFVRSGPYRLAVEFGFLLAGEWP